MVAIADTADQPVLARTEFSRFLPDDLRYISFDAFDDELRKDNALRGARSIVAAEPSSQEMLADQLERVRQVADHIQPPPSLLYLGDFHTDLLAFVRQHRTSFQTVKRLEFQDDRPHWELTIPDFAEFEQQAAGYIEDLCRELRRALILSAITTPGSEFLHNWKYLAGEVRHESGRAGQMRQQICNWGTPEIDELFDILPEGMDRSSALVRSPSQIFARINDLSVRSLIVQRKEIGPPFEPAAWYLFVLDAQRSPVPLRNQDQAVLSEFTNRLLKYHHDLNDRVAELLTAQGCLQSYADIANVFQNAEFLSLHVSQDWIERVSHLKTVPPTRRDFPVAETQPTEQLHCELITQEPNRIVFWAEVADGLRVKTELPAAEFPNPTRTFLWNPNDNFVQPQNTESERQEWEAEVDAGFEEMDELDRRLGKEWE